MFAFNIDVPMSPWLAIVGYAASEASGFPSAPWYMFAVGLALPAVGFIPEAIIAKRLLQALITSG